MVARMKVLFYMNKHSINICTVPKIANVVKSTYNSSSQHAAKIKIKKEDLHKYEFLDQWVSEKKELLAWQIEDLDVLTDKAKELFDWYDFDRNKMIKYTWGDYLNMYRYDNMQFESHDDVSYMVFYALTEADENHYYIYYVSYGESARKILH